MARYQRSDPDRAEAFSAIINLKVEPTMMKQLDEAASDTNRSRAQWIREMLRVGLDLHAQQMERINHDPEDDIPDPSDPSYSEYVQRAGAEQRDRIRAENEELASAGPAKPQKKLNTRDCPHLYKHREGGKCGRCGLPVSQIVTSSNGGRFGGRR